MAEAASQQALDEGKKRLREFLEASDTGRQAIAMSRRGDEFEMHRMNGDKKASTIRGDEDEDDDI